MSMPSTFHCVVTLVKKDFREEFRRKEGPATAAFFALLTTVIFLFAWDFSQFRQGPEFTLTKLGILWVTVLFAGSLFMGRTFHKEEEFGTLTALLLAPIPRFALYLSKFFVNFLFLLILELFIFFLSFFFLNLSFHTGFGLLAMVWLLATIGYAAMGTLFSALVARLQGGGVLFPLLLLPFLIPLFQAAIRASQAAVDPTIEGGLRWTGLLAAFAILSLTVSWVLFEYAIED